MKGGINMLTNYKYEMYPTKEQSDKLNYWIDICRQQYNSALLDKQRHYKEHGKGLSRYSLQKIQTSDKKKHSFLKEIPSQPLQEVFFRLEKSFDKFFRKEARYPKLKKYREYNSITFTQFGVGQIYNKKKGKYSSVRYAASFSNNGKLLISKLGELEVNFHREIPSDGKVKQVILKRQSNRWYAIFCVERQAEPIIAIKDINDSDRIGIDVGIKKFAVLSNGLEYENPKFLRKSKKKLKRVQRKYSKMQKGSNNKKKQLIKLQKLNEKISNQRRDFHHQLSNKLTSQYKFIAVEDLKVKNMIRNRKLSKSISDAGWGQFRRFLEYKCEKKGLIFIKVSPQYTTINCSGCGTPVKKSLSVRTHICPHCGLILDRDHNAAINILSKALSLV